MRHAHALPFPLVFPRPNRTRFVLIDEYRAGRWFRENVVVRDEFDEALYAVGVARLFVVGEIYAMVEGVTRFGIVVEVFDYESVDAGRIDGIEEDGGFRFRCGESR